MIEKNRWLLPEGIEEMLPKQAEHLERLRRQLLDLFHSWGYELVITPLIEYIESLLLGSGDDLDFHTFKLIDQLSGRLLGVRSDITPQVARIVAHRITREAPIRLCYVGAVLHTRPDGFTSTRSPVQVGAELYGHAGIQSDLELLHLMVETLQITGIRDVYIDLGHVGIYRSLAKNAGLSHEQEGWLFEALQRKARPEVEELLNKLSLPAQLHEMLLNLINLNGGEEVLDEAQKSLAGAGNEVRKALAELRHIAEAAKNKFVNMPLHFDLAELRGYHYKTGIVFAAFVPGHGKEIARGGRYDDIGSIYGRARPATGFSTDLRTLIALSADKPMPARAILAPYTEDATLEEAVRRLRKEGERIIYALPGQRGTADELCCDRILEKAGSEWQIKSLS